MSASGEGSAAELPAIATGVQLDADDLMARAQAATGLTDYGDRWFEAPFRHLVGMINREAGLTSAEVAPVQTLVDNLSNRLRLVDYVDRHPEVLDERVEVVGVIIGHARGGSTLLQRMLTSSPRLTAPRWWELISPVPLADEEPGKPEKRLKLAYDWVDAVNRASPEHEAIHPIDPLAYEEEIMLMNNSFLSMMYSSYFRLPSNTKWQAKQDHTRAYAELKLWLQVLQHQDPERRGQKWLLKTVQHMMAGKLDTLVKTFPEAKLIMTHRRLESVIASLCSAQSMLIRASHPAQFDPRHVGPEAMDMYETALREMMTYRQGAAADRFIDVQYEELLRQPVEEYRRIMAAMGLRPTAAELREVEFYLENSPRGNHPPHQYDYSDFGLSREEIRDRLSFYTDVHL